MDTLNRLAALLPTSARALEQMGDRLTEVRMRAGRPVELCGGRERRIDGGPITKEELRRLLARLMDYSLYAREGELAQGYFTLRDGSRVGVCGRLTLDGNGPRMTDIGSVCIRVARAIPGSADELLRRMDAAGCGLSVLLLSPPGMGKTTLLRDAAKQLSERGRHVGVADERHELAACVDGVPTLELGDKTDVIDGGDKPTAIRQLIRGMAPDVIVTDEIGDPGDAKALAEARRCGVSILASAHAGSIEQAACRESLRDMFGLGVFDAAALLGDCPGSIIEWRALH